MEIEKVVMKLNFIQDHKSKQKAIKAVSFLPAPILCQHPPRVFRLNHNTRVDGVSSTLREQGLKSRAIQDDKDYTFRSTKTSKYILKQKRYLSVIPALAAVSDSIPKVPSLSDVIQSFYTCINEKNLIELEGLISSDCFLEDSVFSNSFQGKKEVMGFISQLVESMGENVHFRIGTVCKGDELIASLDWHLEWKENQIPFSRGCSIFHCTIDDGRLVIRKAQIISESPIKPGNLALGLLKILASLFDVFPQAAKRLLKSPHTIFKVARNIYNKFFAPIVNLVLPFYITPWRLVTRLLGYIISILHITAKFVNKKSSSTDPEKSDSKVD